MAYLLPRRAAVLAAALFIAPAGLTLGGCASRTLFTERDPAAGRLRYFGAQSESASATRQRRQQTADMGMGMPNGPSAQ